MLVKKAFVHWWDTQPDSFKQAKDFDACMKAFVAGSGCDSHYWYRAGKHDAITKIKTLIRGLMES